MAKSISPSRIASSTRVERSNVPRCTQHGAVIAREYGKPCVVGIDLVMTKLHDGQRVEVDGTAGVNSITDISPLSGLTSLTNLSLIGNSISDIQPLLDNTGLGAGDSVELGFTSVSCTDVAALRAKGVSVFDRHCPSPKPIRQTATPIVRRWPSSRSTGRATLHVHCKY